MVGFEFGIAVATQLWSKHLHFLLRPVGVLGAPGSPLVWPEKWLIKIIKVHLTGVISCSAFYFQSEGRSRPRWNKPPLPGPFTVKVLDPQQMFLFILSQKRPLQDGWREGWRNGGGVGGSKEGGWEGSRDGWLEGGGRDAGGNGGRDGWLEGGGSHPG